MNCLSFSPPHPRILSTSTEKDPRRHHNPRHGARKHSQILSGWSSITGIGNGTSTGRSDEDHAQPQQEMRYVTKETSGGRSRVVAHHGPGLHEDFSVALSPLLAIYFELFHIHQSKRNKKL